MRRPPLIWFVLSLMVVIPHIVPASAQVFIPPDVMGTRGVIGRGEVKNAAWYPDGSRILISTVAGAFVYTADLEFIAHLPGTALAELSPDGRYIVDVNDDDELVLWDAIQLIRVPVPDQGYFSHITTIGWSPNGRYFAASGVYSGQPLLVVWDTSANWNAIITTRHSGGDQLLWSPRGNYLASFTPGNGGIVWNVAGVGGIAFSVPGLLNVHWQGEISLLTLTLNDTLYELKRWDVRTGEAVELPDLPTSQIVYTVDGQYEAFSGWNDVQITDQLTEGNHESFRVQIVDEDKQALVGILAWSTSSRLLAVGEWSAEYTTPADVVIIDRQSRRTVRRFEGALQSIQMLVWSRNNRFLLVVDDRQQVFVYDLRSGGTRAYSNAHTWVGESLTWNEDGTRIAVADSLQNVTLWDAAHHPEALFTLYDNGGDPVRRIEWQAGQRYIAVQTSSSIYAEILNVVVWDVSQLPPLNVTEQFRRGHDLRFSHFDFTAADTQLALASDRKLWMFDLSGILPQFLVEHTLDARYEDLLMSPDGQGVLLFWDMYGGAIPYRSPEEQNIFRIEVLPFSDRISVWSSDGEAVSLFWEVWDHSYTPNIDPLLLHSTLNGSTAFPQYQSLDGSLHPLKTGFLSPHGSYAATIDSENNGMIWDTHTNEALAWIADAGQLTWSADEQRLAVQRTDGSIWFMETNGRILGHLPTAAAVQHSTGQLIWSPDGGRLAHLHDGIVDIWTFNQ